ncbi:hypothetical protein L861_03210 [Litchfieldella anticariensis FP35 = DSM 16096]|uniref:LysM domain-containing protein n=1 Tax=Litchfieldella anticariensis (strain DSM 16096 / CECT 5854 / CIP 108499 / LMG 22089 / FP35) TaxID=1121939 RepID=S2KQK4_LITA3|nr:hypothetical protein L861_03210 [Halomonas anticariensis FP35 = DSM 16096]
MLLLLLAGCAASPSGTQRLQTIAGDWVTIQRGDTLGRIAARANVPLVRLQRFNPGVDARRLAVGQRILVPSTHERAPSGGPYRYQIRPGDTYSSIARRFGTTPGRVQAANRQLNPTQLKVGQLIQVPLNGSSRVVANASNSRSGGSSQHAPSRPAPAPLPDKVRGWPWPLDDYRVVRQFGTDSRGTLQPMLLATSSGQQAKAVADGEVRFASSMRQLGKVVIVHHADNLQSVYALCDRLSVANGDGVKRGTPLCEVGYSNASERYDLLFDLRHGGKPIDPRQVLR